MDASLIKCNAKALPVALITNDEVQRRLDLKNQPLTRQKLTLKRIGMHLSRYNDVVENRDYSELRVSSATQSTNTSMQYVNRGNNMSNKSSMVSMMPTHNIIQ